MKFRTSLRILYFGALLMLPGLVAAQGPDSVIAHKQIIGRNDVRPIVVSAAVVGLAFAADRSVQRSFQSGTTQSSSQLRNVSTSAGLAADPGVIIFSAATYLAGLATHSRSVAALGMYTGEAVVLGGVVAEVVKGMAGRSRPKIDSLAVRSFNPGKGFSNDAFGAFPSAETTIAFAAATASSRYVSRTWPRASRVVTPAAYAIAALAGASRLYKNEHWASDVVTGAILGSASAVGFDRWNVSHPNNVWVRVFLPSSFTMRGNERRIGWAF